MKYYSKIVEFVKPYKWWLLLSLLFSFLYVIMNTASLWMVSSLISNILNPDNFSTTSNNTIIGYLEKLTFQMIGEGDSLHKLKMLCILLFLTSSKTSGINQPSSVFIEFKIGLTHF